MTLQEIIEETNQDETLQVVKELIRNGKWYEICRTVLVKNLQHLKSLAKVQSELTVASQGLILRGSRIIMPFKLQNRVVVLAHEGHQGIRKTKSLLREKVWFPEMG